MTGPIVAMTDTKSSNPAPRRPTGPDHRFCVAPMMDVTDRHLRYFLRLISKRTLLYTEMITTGALLHGDRKRFLRFHRAERPLALQLGGSVPQPMAKCAALAAEAGFDEVNINVGCPSDRVRAGRFGACLMAEPVRVAKCVAAMRAGSPLPVTVKTRIGVDDRDSFESLLNFVDTVAEAGCETFVVHARKAWLAGLSPKQNREVPPLRYDVVAKLKRERPHLQIVLNGGITCLNEAERHLQNVDGVMVGRGVYRNPFLLAEVDRRIFGDPKASLLPENVVSDYLPYVAARIREGIPLAPMARHLIPLFTGVPGAKAYRRVLSEHARRPGAGTEIIEAALDCLALSRESCRHAAAAA
jgi:tRNA-dihydrouridine synthase A